MLLLLKSLGVTVALSPTVGWQPEGSMRMVPALFAGNESALWLGPRLDEGLGSGGCTEFWEQKSSLVRSWVAKFFPASAFFVRCGPNETAAQEMRQLAQGPFGGRAYLVSEDFAANASGWDGVVVLKSLETEADARAAAANLSSLGLSLGGDSKGYDVAVLVDPSQGEWAAAFVQGLGPGCAGYFRGLQQGVILLPAPDDTIVEVVAKFERARSAGGGRVLVDVWSGLPSDEFHRDLASEFRGGYNFPWLSVAPPLDFETWASQVEQWRAALAAATNATAPGWTQTGTNVLSPQVMIHDRYLYDRRTHQFTVESWLEDVEARYGGVDSVLLWHSYPNIGVDDRSQFDMLDDVTGLDDALAAFHARGVKVLLPYNPWDVGTRPSNQTMAGAVEKHGADGMNGDVMFGVPSSFGGNSIVRQPECGTDARDDTFLDSYFDDDPYRADAAVPANLAADPFSWNYLTYFDAGIQYAGSVLSGPDVRASAGVVDVDVDVPGALPGAPLASRAKLIDSAHNPMVCERWATARTNGLQHALFNGAGYATWENVWGIWNGISDRDAEALRRIKHLFNQPLVARLLSLDFAPYAPNVFPAGVYGSSFNDTLYLFVNRRGAAVPADAKNASTRLPGDTFDAGRVVVDLWNGVVSSEIELEPLGFGAFLVTDNLTAVPDDFLAERRELTATNLSSFDPSPHLLRQNMTLDPTPSTLASSANMTYVEGGVYDLKVHGIQVEGYGGLPGSEPGTQEPDVQFPWESRPQRFHAHSFNISGFYADIFPVTNAEYLAFLQRTDYKPVVRRNFLRHLSSSDDANLQEPVRWVSRQDALAFCVANGKRLPHSWEWSRLATGPNGTRPYPWGDDWDATKVPATDSNRTAGSPPVVGQHPEAASPDGAQDLVATIWQWTDEFCDAHTCRGIVRGGSFYMPVGSAWYFPQARRNDQQNTLLLFDDALDRSGGVGFRCVADQIQE